MTTTERNDNAVLSGKQASRIIRKKIDQAGGSATVTFFQGEKRNITVKDGKIHCTNAHYPSLSFELFDEIVGFLCESGGKAEKGSGRDRVGEKKCKAGTVSYCIATSPFGMAKKPGEFALAPISLVAAILDWAGIARNMEGYLELNRKRASEIIRDKILLEGGEVTVQSCSKKHYKISVNSVKNDTFTCPQLPVPFSFEVFDVIVSLLKKNGGKANKGNARNNRVGQGQCTKDTVVGAIAIDYFGKKDGDSTLDPVFVLAAVLEWAGIARNIKGNRNIKGHLKLV